MRVEIPSLRSGWSNMGDYDNKYEERVSLALLIGLNISDNLNQKSFLTS